MEGSEVEEISLGCGITCASRTWKDKTQEAAKATEIQDAILYRDGSRGDGGSVAGGWAKGSFETGPRSGGEYLREGATVQTGRFQGWHRRWRIDPGAREVLFFLFFLFLCCCP